MDCIIFGIRDGKLNLLLQPRRIEPEKGKWSLMGGFLQTGESVDDAARRVLCELTGIDNVYLRQIGAFGEIDRDPGERVVSIAYYALVNTADVDSASLDRNQAVWCDMANLPELGFDHPEMIERALRTVRRHLGNEPLASKLLPPLFTLSQLQSLYELVFGYVIDKRNFRKRVAENPCIEPTDGIDKSSSKRGARLYRFNPDVKEFKLNV